MFKALTKNKVKSLPLKRLGKKKFKTSPLFVVLFIILAVYTVAMFSLLIWAVLNSFKTQLDFRNNVLGLPQEIAWDNFSTVFSKFEIIVNTKGSSKTINIWQMLLYTILYAGGCALISTVVPCAVAYVTAKFKFRFNAVIYGIVIVAMVLPIVGSAPSEMKILKDLGLYDTLWGSWIQKFHFLGMYFLVFYAAFKSFPDTYMEAAYIDGAGEWKTFLQVVMPLVRNTFLTILLIKFIDYWNDFQTPLLYIPSYPTLAVGLYTIGNSTLGALSWVPRKLAACIIILIPIMTLFIIFRDKLMGNLTMGGIKG